MKFIQIKKKKKFYIEMNYVNSRFNQFVSKTKSNKQQQVTSNNNKIELIQALETELELCRLFDAQFMVNSIYLYIYIYKTIIKIFKIIL